MSVLPTGVCGPSGITPTQSERARLSAKEQALTTGLHATRDSSTWLIWAFLWISAVHSPDCFCRRFFYQEIAMYVRTYSLLMITLYMLCVVSVQVGDSRARTSRIVRANRIMRSVLDG